MSDTSGRARLHLRRTGGIAGVRMEADLDTAELDPPASERLLGALDESDLRTLARRPPAPGRPDGFTYELDIERGDQRHHLRLAEHQVPDSLVPVLDALAERARPAPH